MGGKRKQAEISGVWPADVGGSFVEDVRLIVFSTCTDIIVS